MPDCRARLDVVKLVAKHWQRPMRGHGSASFVSTACRLRDEPSSSGSEVIDHEFDSRFWLPSPQEFGRTRLAEADPTPSEF
jgi:hypothetical protein